MTAVHSRSLLLLAGGILAFSSAVQAQSVQVTVQQENFRKEPRSSTDNRLAILLRGAQVRVSETRGRWIRGSIEGWIWGASTETTDRDGFDLVVSKPEGENLRAAPDGEATRVAVLMRGMLLDSLETRGAWTRVSREAWIWSESTSPIDVPVSVVLDTAARTAPPPPMADRLVVGQSHAGLLLSPDGDTTAVLREGTDMAVLARQGGWTRVRLEGWIWEPSTLPPDSSDTEVLTVEVLRANPDQFRGRRVEWTVQYVALQTAEAIRTDFYEGEPYFLARPPGSSRGILYVAVPPELLDSVRRLGPLDVVDIVARVRTGRSNLMGVPILDLIALR